MNRKSRTSQINDLVQNVRRGKIQRKKLFSSLAALHKDRVSPDLKTTPKPFCFRGDLSKDDDSPSLEIENHVEYFQSFRHGDSFEKEYDSSKGLGFHERCLLWKQKRDERRLRLASERKRKELVSCTFHPNADKRNQVSSSRGKAASFRLFNARKISSEKSIRRMTEARIEIDKKEHRDCTFKPKINESSRKLAQERPSLSQPRPRSSSLPEKKYSFSPKIKGPSKTMLSAQQYLNKGNVVDRLSVMKKKKKVCTKIVNSKKSNQRSFAEFLSRQEKSLRKKSMNNFESGRRPFTPSITKKGQMMRSKSVTDLSANLKHKKKWQVRREQLSLNTEFSLLKEATFSPKVNKKFSKVKSLVRSNPNVASKRLEEKRALYLQEKYIEEMKECTFRPYTRKAPAFIVNVNRSLRRSKS